MSSRISLTTPRNPLNIYSMYNNEIAQKQFEVDRENKQTEVWYCELCGQTEDCCECDNLKD